MESKRSMGNITLEEGYAETKLADSETGYKMSIPVCNAVIPPCWRNTVLKVAEAFMYAYDMFYGRTPEDIQPQVEPKLILADDWTVMEE